MSVVWAHELAGNSGGRETLTPARTWATRSYTRNFQVLTNDKFDGPVVIGSSGTIPSLMDPYIAGNDVDLGAVASNISYNRPNNRQPLIWIATVEYEGADNPLMRPHLIRTGKSVNNRVIWQDVYTGPRGVPIPIVNSAGSYFDPPVTITENRPVFSIERNEPITSDPIALDTFYGNCTNSDPFFGCAPNTVICLGITGADAFEGGIWYWNMQYEFQYRSDTWIQWLLDQGTMAYIPGAPGGGHSTKTYKILDAEGNPISEPVPLDGAGLPLQSPTNPASFVYRPFNVYVSVPFAGMMLP